MCESDARGAGLDRGRDSHRRRAPGEDKECDAEEERERERWATCCTSGRCTAIAPAYPGGALFICDARTRGAP